MTPLQTLWWAQLRSRRNELRTNTLLRVGWIASLVVGLTLGVWGLQELQKDFALWQMFGSKHLAEQLWLLYAGAWVACFLLTLLTLFRTGFGTEPLLLLTLPLKPAVRFRALFSLTLFSSFGSWLPIWGAINAWTLVSYIGWSALPWLLLLLTGSALASWFACVLSLLVIRLVLPALRVWSLSVLVCLLLLGGGLLFLHLIGWSLPSLTGGILYAPDPWLGLSVLLPLLILSWSVLAAPIGNLYLESTLVLESRSGPRDALLLPGVQGLSNLLARSRRPTAALLRKGLLNQGRHFWFWLRVLATAIYLGLFPMSSFLATPYHLSRLLLICAFASLIGVIVSIENAAPYAFSSEGSRLALYLVMPLNPGALLRARLNVFLWPVSALSFLAALFWGWWSGLNWLQLGFVVCAQALIVAGVVTFFVWGSIFDEDLQLSVEGSTQTLLHEELPTTPGRLRLLGIGVILLAGSLLLVWRLAPPMALGALALGDLLCVWASWRLGLRQLKRLVLG